MATTRWKEASFVCTILLLSTSWIAHADISAFDVAMQRIMAKCKAPGGQLAVAKGGELKHSKGYGLANVGLDEPVTTSTFFRYNSVTKVITGTAVLKLVQNGNLSLSALPFATVLADLEPPRGAQVDSRILNITIQHLLQHTSGWKDPDVEVLPESGGPRKVDTLESGLTGLPYALYAAHSVGVSAPAEPLDKVRFMKGRPLRAKAGAAMQYASVGYTILGRVIERVSGLDYGAYVQRNLFSPLGIFNVFLGHTRSIDTPPEETRYYGTDGTDTDVLSVFEGEGYERASYAAVDYDYADSAGSYVGSAADLVKFVVHVDGLRSPRILSDEMVRVSLEAGMSAKREWSGVPHFDHPEGLHWFVSLGNNGSVVSFEHAGGAPGSFSYCVRFVEQNVTVAVLLNTFPSMKFKDFVSFVASELGNATRRTASWPDVDLFA